MNEKLLIVIPCRNEEKNLSGVLESLSLQSCDAIATVVIVENNSTDETLEEARRLAKQKMNFNVEAMTIANMGSLKNAMEFEAFVRGASTYIDLPDNSFTHVMKLDADVRLDPDYFHNIFADHDDFGLCGGRLSGEQKWNIPGCVKLYDLDSFNRLRDFTRAPGWDVMDEEFLRANGKSIVYCGKANFYVIRETGSSEGRISGRVRLGLICKITGYPVIYLFLKLIRYLFVRPYFIGSLCMIYGYASAPPTPYAKSLTENYSLALNLKLRQMFRHPITWFSSTYGKSTDVCVRN
jgi:dolichol-phosphate mannosyltransferase